jgi:hypothetical protein
VAGLRQEPPDEFDGEWDLVGDESPAPAMLATPTVADLLVVADPGRGLDRARRVAMFEGIRRATDQRVAGILGNKRRRHYDGSATLIAVCLELSAVVGRQQAVSEWVAGLRRRYARFSAFQSALKVALATAAPP